MSHWFLFIPLDTFSTAMLLIRAKVFVLIAVFIPIFPVTYTAGNSATVRLRVCEDEFLQVLATGTAYTRFVAKFLGLLPHRRKLGREPHRCSWPVTFAKICQIPL
jgi:hypothetical protein